MSDIPRSEFLALQAELTGHFDGEKLTSDDKRQARRVMDVLGAHEPFLGAAAPLQELDTAIDNGMVSVAEVLVVAKVAIRHPELFANTPETVTALEWAQRRLAGEPPKPDPTPVRITPFNPRVRCISTNGVRITDRDAA